MSATLDSETVAGFLGGCRVMRLEGRRYAVAVEYLAQPPAQPLEALVAQGVGRLLPSRETAGDLLVFLPGMAEIRRAETAVRKAFPQVLAAPLHGELSRGEQDAALRRADRPKVILSTNIAESSLTIEGVNAVIDSGLERSAGYSHWTGVPTLKIQPISRASADQRAGRAGRNAPGRCLRLYTKWDFESRAPFATPEIQRADLAQMALELKALGVDIAAFDWFEAPPVAALAAAEDLLRRLGALGAQGDLTELGRRMVRRAAHPRLAKLMIEASARGAAQAAASLAARLQEGRLEDLDALAEAERDASYDPLLQRARRAFLEFAENESLPAKSRSADALPASLLAAFPDRVARKQSAGMAGRANKTRLLLSAGGSAWVADAPIVRSSNTFVVLDVQERDAYRPGAAELTVRALAPISEEMLWDVTPPALVEREETVWDAERERVMSVSRLSYGELTIHQTRGAPKNPGAASRLLAKEGFHLQPERFPSMTLPEFLTHAAALPGADRLETTAARLALLASHRPDLGAAEITAASLGDLVLHALEGFSSVAEARKLDIAQSILETLPPAARARVDALLPLWLVLPGGRKVAVHYELGQAPWIQSRLQDFFGLKQGPAILEGRLPLTLHLLAPNGRPVQITTDLAGFWQRAYAQLRRELSRNYPRHKWPEYPALGSSGAEAG
jgi:ATP-dependent helicase HrpB